MESGGHPISMDRIPKHLWQQELHYFIVEKLLSIGICRMDVIFKAIKDGVLHVPLSYIPNGTTRKISLKRTFSVYSLIVLIANMSTLLCLPGKLLLERTQKVLITIKGRCVYWFLFYIVVRYAFTFRML